MAHFIVDLDLIYQLEISLRRKLKPNEILVISYVKSFPKGYYGSKVKLAERFNISKSILYEMMKDFLEKKILIKEKNNFLFNMEYLDFRNSETNYR
jgi:DNA-binding MarR family transcriptional regulator